MRNVGLPETQNAGRKRQFETRFRKYILLEISKVFPVGLVLFPVARNAIEIKPGATHGSPGTMPSRLTLKTLIAA